MRAFIALCTLPLAFVVGCGPDCQSSCNRIFGSSDGQCNMIPAGINDETEIQDLNSQCVAECQRALSNPGPATYDPNERHTSETHMSTDKDAALWMDCVNESACEDLGNGICAPTQNFN